MESVTAKNKRAGNEEDGCGGGFALLNRIFRVSLVKKLTFKQHWVCKLTMWLSEGRSCQADEQPCKGPETRVYQAYREQQGAAKQLEQRSGEEVVDKHREIQGPDHGVPYGLLLGLFTSDWGGEHWKGLERVGGLI